MSDFWKRVDEELEYLGQNRAYLSRKCGFSLANIGKGIKLGSVPNADTAIKIAEVLGVSVEFLVNGTEQSTSKTQEDEQNQLKLYRKYHDIIKDLEALPQNKYNIVKNLVAELAKI
ncbi:MAG: helix-turn-helix transcriptional regulator [Treponema sp.]|nr:helix-turn-helix transcriptional regulator [Treponema sp.]